MRPVSSRILRHFGTTTFSRPQSYLSRSLHPSITKLAMELEAQAVEAPNMEQAPDYTSWSHEQLIERVTKLEKELKITNQSLAVASPKTETCQKPRPLREFDPSRYSSRLVAFKLAYLGKKYNGFEYHKGNWTPLPTIEEELFKAFTKGRLIFPTPHPSVEPGEVNWEGTDYTKCGRTDKGVSAFGQVIGIRVRSNRPLRKRKQKLDFEEVAGVGTLLNEDYGDAFNGLSTDDSIEMASPILMPSRGGVEDMPAAELDFDDLDFEDALNFDPIKDELPYCQLLNRLLPPDIRILAWCPSPPLDFSARFACRERRYRYFFTQPAFSPIPDRLETAITGRSDAQTKPGWLDIEAMREAAKLFVGEHDFRNFCKIDGSKQIWNFNREIFHASIEEVDDYTGALSYLNEDGLRPAGSTDSQCPKVYTFNLHGGAFLWHQVRHIVAILFLIGQGLEKASVITELLDVKKNPRRPIYEMASDTPLVLWDCIFPKQGDVERKDAIHWLHVGDGVGNGGGKYENGGLMECLWKNWRETKMDEMLAGSLMGVVARQGDKELPLERGASRSKPIRSQKVFEGNDTSRLQGLYKPVMQKHRMDSAEVINEKYAHRKGFEDSEEMKAKGYRRLKLTGKS